MERAFPSNVRGACDAPSERNMELATVCCAGRENMKALMVAAALALGVGFVGTAGQASANHHHHHGFYGGGYGGYGGGYGGYYGGYRGGMGYGYAPYSYGGYARQIYTPGLSVYTPNFGVSVGNYGGWGDPSYGGYYGGGYGYRGGCW